MFFIHRFFAYFPLPRFYTIVTIDIVVRHTVTIISIFSNILYLNVPEKHNYKNLSLICSSLEYNYFLLLHFHFRLHSERTLVERREQTNEAPFIKSYCRKVKAFTWSISLFVLSYSVVWTHKETLFNKIPSSQRNIFALKSAFYEYNFLYKQFVPCPKSCLYLLEV